MSQTHMNDKVLKLVQLGLLTAIILLMGFTPIGYVKLGVIELTFITVPVIIGAMVLSPGAGAFLGGVFGATSFVQCLSGASAFGATLLGINPFFTALVCLVPRIIMGWLCGLIFKALYPHDSSRSWSFIVSSLSGALLNTIGFTGLLIAFFWSSEYIQGLASSVGATGVLGFSVAFVGIQGLIEAGVCTLLGAAVGRALARYIRHVSPKPRKTAVTEETAERPK